MFLFFFFRLLHPGFFLMESLESPTDRCIQNKWAGKTRREDERDEYRQGRWRAWSDFEDMFLPWIEGNLWKTKNTLFTWLRKGFPGAWDSHADHIHFNLTCKTTWSPHSHIDKVSSLFVFVTQLEIKWSNKVPLRSRSMFKTCESETNQDMLPASSSKRTFVGIDWRDTLSFQCQSLDSKIVCRSVWIDLHRIHHH